MTSYQCFRTLSFVGFGAAAVGILIALLAVPVGAFFATAVIGLSMGLVLSALLFALSSFIFGNRWNFRGVKDSIAAFGVSIVAVIVMVFIVASTIDSLPHSGTAANVAVVVCIVFVAAVTITWSSLMLMKSIRDSAWTTDPRTRLK
jgi:amino acid permease